MRRKNMLHLMIAVLLAVTVPLLTNGQQHSEAVVQHAYYQLDDGGESSSSLLSSSSSSSSSSSGEGHSEGEGDHNDEGSSSSSSSESNGNTCLVDDERNGGCGNTCNCPNQESCSNGNKECVWSENKCRRQVSGEFCGASESSSSSCLIEDEREGGCGQSCKKCPNENSCVNKEGCAWSSVESSCLRNLCAPQNPLCNSFKCPDGTGAKPGTENTACSSGICTSDLCCEECTLQAHIKDEPAKTVSIFGDLVLDASPSTLQSDDNGQPQYRWTACHKLTTGCSSNDFPPFQELPHQKLVTIDLATMGIVCPNGTTPSSSGCYDPTALIGETYRFTVAVGSNDCEDSASIEVTFIGEVEHSSSSSESVPCALQAIVSSLPTSGEIIVDASASHVGERGATCPNCEFSWKVCSEFVNGACLTDSVPAWLTAASTKHGKLLRVASVLCSEVSNTDDTVLCTTDSAALLDVATKSYRFVVTVDQDLCTAEGSTEITFPEAPQSSSSEPPHIPTFSPTPIPARCNIVVEVAPSPTITVQLPNALEIDVSGSYDSSSPAERKCPGCKYDWTACKAHPEQGVCPEGSAAPSWLSDLANVKASKLTIEHDCKSKLAQGKLCVNLADWKSLGTSEMFFTVVVSRIDHTCEAEAVITVDFVGEKEIPTPTPLPCALTATCGISTLDVTVTKGKDAEFTLDASGSSDAVAAHDGSCPGCKFKWKVCHGKNEQCTAKSSVLDSSSNNVPSAFNGVDSETSSKVKVSLPGNSFDPTEVDGQSYRFSVTVTNSDGQCTATSFVDVSFTMVIPTVTPTPIPTELPCPLVVDLKDAPSVQHLITDTELTLDAGSSYDARSGESKQCLGCVFTWQVCQQLASECSSTDLPVPFQKLSSTFDATVLLRLTVANESCLPGVECPSPFDPTSLIGETYVFTVTAVNELCNQSKALAVTFTEPAVACSLSAAVEGATFRTHPIPTGDLVLDASKSADNSGECPNCLFTWSVCLVDSSAGTCETSFPQEFLHKVEQISTNTLRIFHGECGEEGSNADDVVCADTIADLHSLIGSIFRFKVRVDSEDCASTATVDVGFVSANNLTCERCVLFSRVNVAEQVRCTYDSVSKLYEDENNISPVTLVVNPTGGLSLVDSQYNSNYQWKGLLQLQIVQDGNISLELPDNSLSPLHNYGTTAVPRCDQMALESNVCNAVGICDPDFHSFDSLSGLCKCAAANAGCDADRDCLLTISGEACNEVIEMTANIALNCDTASLSVLNALVYSVSSTCPSGACTVDITSTASHPKYPTQSIFFSGNTQGSNTIALKTASTAQNLTFSNVDTFTDSGNELTKLAVHGPADMTATFSGSTITDCDFTVGKVDFSGASFTGFTQVDADTVQLQGTTTIETDNTLQIQSSTVDLTGDVSGGGKIIANGQFKSFNADNKARDFALVGLEPSSSTSSTKYQSLASNPAVFTLCGLGPNSVEIPNGGILQIKPVCSEGGLGLQMTGADNDLTFLAGGKLEVDTADALLMDFASVTPKITSCKWEKSLVVAFSSPLEDSHLFPIINCLNAVDDELPIPEVENCPNCALKWIETELWVEHNKDIPTIPGKEYGDYYCDWCVMYKWPEDVDGVDCHYSLPEDADVTFDDVDPAGDIYPESALDLSDYWYVDTLSYDFSFEVTDIVGSGVTYGRIDQELRSPLEWFDVVVPPKCNANPVRSDACQEFEVCDLYHTYNNVTNLCECTGAPGESVDPVCEAETGLCVQVVNNEELCKLPLVQTANLKMKCEKIKMAFGEARKYKVPMGCDGEHCDLEIGPNPYAHHGDRHHMKAQQTTTDTTSPPKVVVLAGQEGKANSVNLSDSTTNYTYTLANLTSFSVGAQVLNSAIINSVAGDTEVKLTGTTLLGSRIKTKTITSTDLTIDGTTPTTFVAESATLTGIALKSTLLLNVSSGLVSGEITGAGTLRGVGNLRIYNPKSQTHTFVLTSFKSVAKRAASAASRKFRTLQTSTTPTVFEICGKGPSQVEVPAGGTLVLPLFCNDGGGPMQMTNADSKITFEAGSALKITESTQQSLLTGFPHATECAWGSGEVAITIDPQPTKAFTGLKCDRVTGVTPKFTTTSCLADCPCNVTFVDGELSVKVSGRCVVSPDASPAASSPAPAADVVPRASPGSSSVDAGLIGGLVGGLVGGFLVIVLLICVYLHFNSNKDEEVALDKFVYTDPEQPATDAYVPPTMGGDVAPPPTPAPYSPGYLAPATSTPTPYSTPY